MIQIAISLLRGYVAKKFLVILISFLVVLTSCQNPDSDIFSPIFKKNDASPDTTTLVIKQLSDDKIWTSNSKRAELRYIPASTSKIPHTLIALETELAAPETFFKWDGRPRTFKSWNQDQTLITAYRRSAVWVYQEIAQTLGSSVMREWLERFDYGNADIGADDNVTQYWLTGPLAISAHEQVDFLTKLATHKLLLSPKTYAQARSVFQNENQKGHTLYAKTGWMFDEDAMDIGWFVGWVEIDDPKEIYVFALNMDMPQSGDQKKRKPIVMDALKSIGAWVE